MKNILYLGTDPTHFKSQGHTFDHLTHYPVIKIVPISFHCPEIKRAYEDLEKYTHLIFTSKNTVQIFFSHLNLETSVSMLNLKKIIAIGSVTAASLAAIGVLAQFVPFEETQEGVVKLLKTLPLEGAYFFIPHSSRSRPVLTDFLKEQKIVYLACDLYDTQEQELTPRPNLADVDTIIFTSPSTVDGFLKIYKIFPQDKKLQAIGPVTEKYLSEKLRLKFTRYR